MVAHKINDVVNETATLTNTSTQITASVITHMFNEVVQYMRSPDKAGLRITYLGLIYPYKRAVRSRLTKLVSLLRQSQDSLLVEEFRQLWKLRLLIDQDLKRRKRNE
jgi:hypothetical protein